MTESMWLKIAKDDFKFSSAHMSYISNSEKEALHGHNYYIQCSFKVDPAPSRQFIDFSVLKKCVRQICKLWDEKILLPNSSASISTEKESGLVRLSTHGMTYVFPESEVVILETPNVILENISLLFLDKLITALKGLNLFDSTRGPIYKVQLSMEETRGQSVEVVR